MATAVTNVGSWKLFNNGWTSSVAWARLYTSSNALVDQQSCTLTFSGSTMSISSAIVFDIDTAVDDVAYIILGYTSGYPLDEEYYSKDLPALYDFDSAGTLTVNSWSFTIGGTSLTASGREVLAEDGFVSTIVSAKLRNSSDGLLDTQSVTMSASSSTGVMSISSNIVFGVAKNGVGYYIELVNSGGTQLYKRILSTSYTFAEAGTLTVSAWNFSI